MTAATTVGAGHLITPHFVVEGSGIAHEIGSMPGVNHVSADKLIEEVGFDVSFSFVYSARPGTPAADLPDTEKALRLAEPVGDRLQGRPLGEVGGQHLDRAAEAVLEVRGQVSQPLAVARHDD